jgi:hypothetical protein
MLTDQFIAVLFAIVIGNMVSWAMQETWYAAQEDDDE